MQMKYLLILPLLSSCFTTDRDPFEIYPQSSIAITDHECDQMPSCFKGDDYANKTVLGYAGIVLTIVAKTLSNKED